MGAGMEKSVIQDNYEKEFAHCFGCGRLNSQGLQLKSYWVGDRSVCRFSPQSHHSGGYPESLYGGLIASLFDCHGAATAWGAVSRIRTLSAIRFVTVSLNIDFLKPVSMGGEVTIWGEVEYMGRRKVAVNLKLEDEKVCGAIGRGVFVEIPQDRYL